MTLRELQATFVKRIDNRSWRRVDTKTEADGIIFLCPVCYQANGSDVGTHSIICWDPTVPEEMSPGPGRWRMEGTGFDDLSLRANSSSVALTSGCKAHFHVTDGKIA